MEVGEVLHALMRDQVGAHGVEVDGLTGELGGVVLIGDAGAVDEHGVRDVLG